MPEVSLRFGVQDDEGKRASTWKLWTEVGKGNSEIYLACRALRGTLKTSMHQSGNWHTAYSPDVFEKDVKGTSHTQENRFIEKWPRPNNIAPGLTLALRIVTPWSAVTVTSEVKNQNKVQWLKNAPIGKAVEIDVFISKPTTLITGWPGKRSMETYLIGNILLENGETLWAVYWLIDMPNFTNWHNAEDMKFYKGRNKEDLKQDGLRMLVFGSEADNSRVIYDLAVIKDSK